MEKFCLNTAITRMSRVIFIKQGLLVESVSSASESTHRTNENPNDGVA